MKLFDGHLHFSAQFHKNVNDVKASGITQERITRALVPRTLRSLKKAAIFGFGPGIGFRYLAFLGSFPVGDITFTVNTIHITPTVLMKESQH